MCIHESALRKLNREIDRLKPMYTHLCGRWKSDHRSNESCVHLAVRASKFVSCSDGLTLCLRSAVVSIAFDFRQIRIEYCAISADLTRAAVSDS